MPDFENPEFPGFQIQRPDVPTEIDDPAADPEPNPLPEMPERTKYPLDRPWHRRHPLPKNYCYARSNRWYDRAIEAYSRSGSIVAAAYVTNVSPHTIKNRMKSDPEFGAAMEEAGEQFGEGLEEVLFRLAIEGEDRYTLNRDGERVWMDNKKNIVALIVALKRWFPERYRENFKKDDKDGSQFAANMMVNFIKTYFDPASDDQSNIPSLDAYMKGQVSLPAPETAADKRARLLRELAALDAEDANPPNANP